MTIHPKQLAGERAAEYVEDGMVVGLGTGSTAFFAIQKLGQRIAKGLDICGIPTSEQSRIQAESENIPLIDFAKVTRIDLTIDGADEFDPDFNLIKGGGGALLREKIVASLSDREIIVADESKPVAHLGAFPLPVEVIPFGWQAIQRLLAGPGLSPHTSQRAGQHAFCHRQRQLHYRLRLWSHWRSSRTRSKNQRLVRRRRMRPFYRADRPYHHRQNRWHNRRTNSCVNEHWRFYEHPH